MLSRIHIKFRKTNSTEDRNKQWHPADKAFLKHKCLHERIKHHRWKHSETDNVRKGIKLFAHIRISTQESRHKSIQEVKNGSSHHEVKCHIKTALKCKHYPDDSTKEIHRGNAIGNITDNLLHQLFFYLFPKIFRESRLMYHNANCLSLHESFSAVPYSFILTSLTP